MLTADALLAELGAIRAEGGVVAFDADGTLWEGDVGYDALYALFDAGVHETALPALREEARSSGLDPSGDATALGRRLVQAYFDGKYDETRAFGMMAWVFAGMSEGEAVTFSARVLAEKGIASRVRPVIPRILAWAREAGAEAILVSASPAFVLDAALAATGLRFAARFGMEVALEGDRLAPRLSAPPTTGPGKLEALRRARPDKRLVAAFGDGAWDRPMVEAAELSVAMGKDCPLAKLPIEGLRVLEV